MTSDQSYKHFTLVIYCKYSYSHYDSRVTNYELEVFIRLNTDVTMVCHLAKFSNSLGILKKFLAVFHFVFSPTGSGIQIHDHKMTGPEATTILIGVLLPFNNF